MTKARTLADNFAADINGITAGTGITGGGTSGTVTITNDMATTIAAKGDLVVGTGNDTYAALTAGNAGDTLVADSSATTGLRWQGSYAAGKNAIINGAFDYWQRGTSFDTTALGNLTYTADRWTFLYSTLSGSTVSISSQTFTPGAAPVAGYEGTYFMRWTCTTAGSGANPRSRHKIEDVRQFAGQTVTFSFWAKADTNRTLDLTVQQNFGSGGSATVNALVTTYSATSSWQRFSYTFTMPSISGKTIGTNSFVDVQIYHPMANGATLDLWGVQLEAGSVATAFSRAAGTLAGELAACQRYYQVLTRNNFVTTGQAYSTSAAACGFIFPVEMRGTPTISLAAVGSGAGQMTFVTSAAGIPGTLGGLAAENINKCGFRLTQSSATSAFTAGNATLLFCDNADIYRASAEL